MYLVPQNMSYNTSKTWVLRVPQSMNSTNILALSMTWEFWLQPSANPLVVPVALPNRALPRPKFETAAAAS